MNIGDGRRNRDGRQEKDFVNAAVGWVSPFRGSRGERGEEERQREKEKGKSEE